MTPSGAIAATMSPSPDALDRLMVTAVDAQVSRRADPEADDPDVYRLPPGSVCDGQRGLANHMSGLPSDIRAGMS